MIALVCCSGTTVTTFTTGELVCRNERVGQGPWSWSCLRKWLLKNHWIRGLSPEATDALEKGKDKLRLMNQQFKVKCGNHRVSLSANKENLICNQRAEKSEDQTHHWIIRVAEFWGWILNLNNSAKQSPGCYLRKSGTLKLIWWHLDQCIKKSWIPRSLCIFWFHRKSLALPPPCL